MAESPAKASFTKDIGLELHGGIATDGGGGGGDGSGGGGDRAGGGLRNSGDTTTNGADDPGRHGSQSNTATHLPVCSANSVDVTKRSTETSARAVTWQHPTVMQRQLRPSLSASERRVSSEAISDSLNDAVSRIDWPLEPSFD